MAVENCLFNQNTSGAGLVLLVVQGAKDPSFYRGLGGGSYHTTSIGFYSAVEILVTLPSSMRHLKSKLRSDRPGL